MQEPYKNKTYTTFDYMVIAIGFLLVALITLAYNSCSRPPLVQPIEEVVTIAEIRATDAQNRYDSLSLVTAKQMDSLELVIAESKKNTKQIIVRYKYLHDTISITPEGEQIQITKMLCPATGDSVDLKEINYCLASGKQSEELYKNSLQEINALEVENKLNEGLIIEGLKNMESKDTLIDSYRNANTNLSEGLEKQKHRKKVWRNYSCGATIIATILALIVAL